MAGTQEIYIGLFKSIGLSQTKANEAAKSPKSASILQDLIEQNSLVGSLDEKQAALVASLAGQLAKSPNVTDDAKRYLIEAIRSGRLKTVDQLTGL
jgi:glutaminyl-tRNA synthetase